MTYFTTNAHGSRVKITVHKITVHKSGNRLTKRRALFVQGQWVPFARSSRPIQKNP